MNKSALASLFLAVGLACTAVTAAPAPQLSVIQSELTYQASFIDLEQVPDAPILGTLSGWIGQTLTWEFRSTFPDPQGVLREGPEFGGTARDWFLPNSSGSVASRGMGASPGFIGGLSVSTFDNQTLSGVGAGVLDGTYDGLLWSGFAQGATFVPGVGPTGFEYSIEMLGSVRMLNTPESPTLGPGTIVIDQIELVTLVAREWADGVLIGSAGASGSLDTLNVRFTPEGAFAITAVPEPGTWVMMLGGFAALGAFSMRRTRRQIALS